MTLIRQLQQLLPSETVQIASVLAHHGDGTSTVQSLDGQAYRVRGTSVAIGVLAYIRSGTIDGAAAALTSFNADV